MRTLTLEIILVVSLLDNEKEYFQVTKNRNLSSIPNQGFFLALRTHELPPKIGKWEQIILDSLMLHGVLSIANVTPPLVLIRS